MLLFLLLIPLVGIFLVLYVKNNVLSISFSINDEEEDDTNSISPTFSENGKFDKINNETSFLSTKFLDDKEKYNSSLNKNFYLSNIKSTKDAFLSEASSREIIDYWHQWCTEKIRTDIYEPYVLSKGNSFLNRISFGNYRKTIKLIVLSTSILNLLISLLIFILFDYSTNQLQFVQDYHEITFFNLYLGIDGLSIYFILLTTIIIPISLLSNWKSISKIIESYVILMLLLETLLLAVFLVLDVLLFYIFFESILPPLFILIGLFGSNNRVKASFYLFLYTLLGSLFLLLSILSMSSIMGTTDYDTLYKGNVNYSTQIFIFYGIFIAFAVKTPTIFLNTWLLKAHVESPLGGSIILAGIVLKLSLYGILRLILPTLPKAYIEYTYIIYVIGFITIAYASISTLRTIDVKELIAYSSVSHAAVYLVGILSNIIQSIEGAILLGIGHGFVSPGLFICGGGVLYDRSSSRLLSFYRGMAQLMPLFAILFFILCLGNCGAPLTLNFIGEFLSLYGVFERLPIMGAICSISIVLSAAYTIYMYNRISFGGNFSNLFTINIPDLKKREFHLLLTLVLLTVLFGIYPISLFKAMDYSVSTVLYLGNYILCDASTPWGSYLQDTTFNVTNDVYGNIIENFYLVLLFSYIFVYVYTKIKPDSVYKYYRAFFYVKITLKLILEFLPLFIWLGFLVLYIHHWVSDFSICFISSCLDSIGQFNEIILSANPSNFEDSGAGNGNYSGPNYSASDPSSYGGSNDPSRSEGSGTHTNSSQTNGSQNNGTHTNGSQTNGSHTNGTHTNSSQTNGSQNNGTHTNGTHANTLDEIINERIRNCVHPSRDIELLNPGNYTVEFPCSLSTAQNTHNIVTSPTHTGWLCKNCNALLCNNCLGPGSDSD